MQSIFKIVVLFSFLFLISCENTELDLLDDPNAVSPENAEVGFLFNNVQLAFGNFFDNASNLTMPYTRMTAMTGGNQYRNSISPNSFLFTWSNAYATFLPDADAVIAINEAGGLPDQLAQASATKVMKAYVLMNLVDMFGDIPYSEYGQGFNNPSPNADDDEAVYNVALGLLDEAIRDLNGNDGTVQGDFVYDGSPSKWLKAANTLKIRYFMTTRLVNSNAAAEINTILASGDYIQDAADDFQLNYGTQRSNPDSRSPRYASQYEVANGIYHSNHYMFEMLFDKALPDPRINYYFYRQDCDISDEDQFTLDCPFAPVPSHYPDDVAWCTATEDGYWGREHGNNDGIPPDGNKRTVWGLYPAGGKYDDGSCASVKNQGVDGARGAGIGAMMLSSFVDLYLAEGALVAGVDGDPVAYLESGVRKSFDKVLNFNSSQVPAGMEATQDDVDAYVSLVLSAFNDATTDDERLEVIVKELWFASFGNGMEMFNTYRRTGVPNDFQPTREEGPGPFPRSFWYPANYVNFNSNASQKAELNEQVFWDTNPADGWVD